MPDRDYSNHPAFEAVHLTAALVAKALGAETQREADGDAPCGASLTMTQEAISVWGMCLAREVGKLAAALDVAAMNEGKQPTASKGLFKATEEALKETMREARNHYVDELVKAGKLADTSRWRPHG